MRAWRLPVALAVSCFGCVGPLANLKEVARTPLDGVPVVLRHAPDAQEVELLVDALSRATPAVRRWGGLSTAVTLHVVPHHRAFERALGRAEPTLHAWARYDEILLESPASWGADVEQLRALLAHELTHCVTFQRLGTAQDWQQRVLPFWFREGLATVTAGQAADFPTLEELAGALRPVPIDEAFDRAERSVSVNYRHAYGLAHHAVVFLLRRHGDGAVPQILAALREGKSFDDAFKAATGVERLAFEHDALNYIRLRGFRGWGLPLKTLPSPRAK